MTMRKLEVWVCADVAGDYAVGSSEEHAKERFEEEIGELNATGGFRLVQLWLTVPLPTRPSFTAHA